MRIKLNVTLKGMHVCIFKTTKCYLADWQWGENAQFLLLMVLVLPGYNAKYFHLNQHELFS